jgi:hypothetical protein
MKMADKRPIDWDQIEISFRAGKISGRQIAHRHGISEGAVRKRAKAGNWVRVVRPTQKKSAGPIVAPLPSGLTAQQLAAGDVDLAISALVDVCLNGKIEIHRVRAAKLLLRIADSKSGRSSGA